ncbi:hypothetical protein BGX27_004783 [Mortierella sp. AM989]|nr:hypothetical protein BGX27_004783 [Mortierella sp. AM989]
MNLKSKLMCARNTLTFDCKYNQNFIALCEREIILADKDQDLYNEAAKWFKSKMRRDVESVIQNVRAMSLGCMICPTTGTNVDAYYVARDDFVDIIFESDGSPTYTDHSKFCEDKQKSFRNAVDACLSVFTAPLGRLKIVIVFGHDLSIYTTNIKDANEFPVSKIFQGEYHFSKDAYLTNILLHLKFCLTIKTIMERNMDVSIDFGNSIESLPIEEQAHFNLQLHTTPTKVQTHRQSSIGGSQKA